MPDNNSLNQQRQGLHWKVWYVLNERLGLDSLSYHVPGYANSLPYLLGGITLFSFIILILSGIYIAQYYNPNPTYAHQSVMFITAHVPFGDFIRSIHYWSANVAMIFIILHAIRVFVMASYKRPREVTWFSGITLLGLTLAFVFTGTVLKWDQEGIEALAHNEALAGFLGKIGTILTSGFTNSVSILTRLYNVHTTLLVLCFAAILFVHLFLIKRHGISQKAEYGAVSKSTSGTGSSYFYLHLRKLVGFGLIAFSGIALLSVLFPAPLGQLGVPGMELTKPPWMFLPFYAMENLFGLQALIWSPVILFTILLLIPLLDRSPWVSPRQRKIVVAAGAILFAILIALTLFAAFAPIKNHLGGEMGRNNQNKNHFSLHLKLPQLVPIAYAHGMALLQVSPTTVEAGGKLVVKGDGLKSATTYTLIMEGLQSSLILGTVTTPDDEDMFDVEFLLPSSLNPDIFQLKAVDSSGEALYAGDNIAVVHTEPDFNDKANHPEISRQKSPDELLIIYSTIAVSLCVGLLLIHDPRKKYSQA